MSRVSRAMTTILKAARCRACAPRLEAAALPRLRSAEIRRRRSRADVGHYFLCHERFNRIADFDVVEILNADTAFVAFGDFGCVFLESLQRRNLPLEYHNVVAQEPN